ncbi:MAG: flagellar motor switch protein FliM [Bacteroides sp.]|nr:flagellar motor switch protein FliM [Eubacterium sp.]MCM1419468.1 flagellar motor switch protein FliM [Roseburia sp.]MCM1463328.1 flagellar motor switch protein FliM [Bacteroides sp.]
MAETLTQEQIDALLNSAMSGEVVESKDEKKSEAKEYDFRSPKKFTKERIKVLDSIFDNYARLLSSYLTGLLRLYCKVSLESIEEQRYFEFNNGLPDYVMMGTVDLGVNDDEIDNTPTIIQLSNSLTYILIDRLLGGRGEYKDADRDFTEIEVSIVQKIINNLASLLREPWEPYVEVTPTVLNIETNSRVFSAVDYDDTMIIVCLEVAVNDTKTIVTISMPVLNLDEVMQKYVSKTVRSVRRLDASREQERRETIMRALNESSLDVTAVLGEITLDVADILNLQVDDIIPLDKNINSNVVLKIDNKPWFDGKMGTLNQNKAVKIETVYRSEV